MIRKTMSPRKAVRKTTPSNLRTGPGAASFGALPARVAPRRREVKCTMRKSDR